MIGEIWPQFYALAMDLRAEIFSILVTLLAYIANRVIYGPAKLKWAVEHEHHYLVPIKDNDSVKHVVHVDTVAIFIQNTGRSAADDVGLIFNYEPKTYDVVPPKKFQTHVNPDGRFVVTFEKLRAKEYASIRLIDIKPSEIPIILNVFHRTGSGIRVPMCPQQIFSRPFLLFCASMFFVGIATCIYVFVSMLSFVIK